MGYRLGQKAEEFFESFLTENKIEFTKCDEWYDYEIGNHKIEVKSCKPAVRNEKGGMRIGRFDFTSEDNREQQYNANCWVCFIIRHFDQHIIYGFCRAQLLNKKRYISIPQARLLDLIYPDEWLEMIKC